MSGRNDSIGVGVLVVALAGAQANVEASNTYFYDFESAVGQEWSTTQSDTTPIGGRNFLGQFINDSVTLTLANLPSHGVVTISFDLFIIRTWDGNITTFNGPDRWKLEIVDEATLIDTTFRAEDGNSSQAYPDWYPDGEHEPGTGAVEQNTLGYNTPPPDGDPVDNVYRLSYSFPHGEDSVTFRFSADLQWDGVTPLELDETWGLDNVEVVLGAPIPTVSEWAAVAMTLLLLVAGTVVFASQRRQAAA